MVGPCSEKKSLKREHVPTSDSKLYVEDYVMDIMSSSRREVGWKKIPVNVPSTPLDIVSFHYKVSVQKWKFVF